jgi:hypothetical protein
MIHDLDKTLQKILYEKGRLNRNEIDIAFDQPTGQWSATLSRPTINCWMFDMRENARLRSLEMTVDRDHQTKRARTQLAPMRFDLSYLVTAWTRKVEDEHQLLWRALAALSTMQRLDPAECEGSLRNQPYEIPFQVAQEHDHGVTMTDLWSVLNNDMRPGFFLSVTLALEPEVVLEAPLVLESLITVGQAESPEDEQIDVPETFRIRLPSKRRGTPDAQP